MKLVTEDDTVAEITLCVHVHDLAVTMAKGERAHFFFIASLTMFLCFPSSVSLPLTNELKACPCSAVRYKDEIRYAYLYKIPEL